MEDIRLYDFNARLLHIENHIISTNWTIYYNKIGTFEGHFDIKSDILPHIMEQPHLILTQGQKQAIITGRQCGEELILYGRTVNDLLTKRVTLSFTEADLPPSGNARDIAHWLVQNAFDAQDKLICKANAMPFLPISDFSLKSPMPTGDLVADCLGRDGAGHRLIFNHTVAGGRFEFEAVKGREIPLILSQSNQNAYQTEYIQDEQKHINGGWYQNESTGVWTLVPSTESGIHRRLGVLKGETLDEARRDLQSRIGEKRVQTKAKELDFSLDYEEESYQKNNCHLGDMIRVQIELGSYKITNTMRIIGMDFWYENNNIGMQPILESVVTA